MKLLIAGKHIHIEDYVELIAENPLINNFDAQHSQYSNAFELKYNGDITELLDISQLRKAESPYLVTDGYIIDGVIFIPVKIIISSFDVVKNTIKMNVTEKITAGAGGITVRETKLTELRHTLTPVCGGAGEFTDEIIKADGTLDVSEDDSSYLGEDSVLADPQTYPHAITSGNSCPLVSLEKFIAFLSDRYGMIIEDCPLGDPFPINGFFANRQLPFAGDLLRGAIALSSSSDDTERIFYPVSLVDYPAGILSSGLLPSGSADKVVTYKNKIGDLGCNFVSCVVLVAEGTIPNSSQFQVYFKTQLLTHISIVGQAITYGIEDLDEELDLTVKATGTIDRAIAFRVVNSLNLTYQFSAVCRFNVDIPGNTAQATDDNSRQVFQNMPDVTILDLFKSIAKATAKYIEITATGLKFIDIANSLTPGAIVDASQHLIGVKGVSYNLYNASSLEYWYKEAETATLTIPIADERVSGVAKKVEIDMLRTDDANVNLFEDDGIKPLVGIATFPFLDITDYALDLAAFYLSIQKPFIVTATFRKFNMSLSNSLLIRQLNGLFIPKKIIKTNKDIIELELLKIEA